MNSLYRLKTFNDNDIEKIFNDIKFKLIETDILSPSQILPIIKTASKFNNYYFRSYWTIFKKVIEEYQLKQAKHIGYIFDYFFYKEYGFLLEEKHQKYILSYNANNYSLDVHNENTIFRSIMDDDIKSFITLIRQNDDSVGISCKSKFYKSGEQYSLLELCCYYGSVNCFKFLRTEFEFEITPLCCGFSFLGGNPDIIAECSKKREWDLELSMEYAIISHNLDFYTFLKNEYQMDINLEYCSKYNNLQAFLIYLDQTRDYDQCFIHSYCFNNLNLCEYLLKHGANIDAKYQYNETALHIVTRNNNKEFVKYLISHGANPNIQDNNLSTPLHYAIENNDLDILELFILHGANVNIPDKFGNTPFHKSVEYNKNKIAKLFVSHGAKLKTRNNRGESVLHISTRCKNKELVELLVV
ncbi:hypothetical protein TVAG_277640 [Trichomonas vaginalis G3]|uniref:DUF3447 domain-containing protein n=1 Tax=Trichomonas vaginalis (strain ATCC PRA-98 / G3) TaxID=412133 RepID=A2FF25_TRIV3|nr:protein ubiquitination [Trichomonas vaginalis G3]EAX96483.1 hypothetical protein TVAG_277640 [Trichomonas vaginalis G3]KAI5552092.1 protein ubiquitination [Trichomonas vaginalis G3]|eukprot:XP_001309413.1 hypothetical protein [Trichomonas vaginalis G3]